MNMKLYTFTTNRLENSTVLYPMGITEYDGYDAYNISALKSDQPKSSTPVPAWTLFI